MSFAHPGWLALLLILPFILLGAILAHRGRSKAWQRMIAPRLRAQLVNQASFSRRWLSLALGLLGSTLIIIVIARPYIGETTTTEHIRTRNILIAIDTSRSMLVRDGSPDRMASAQASALELLDAFPNDRVGIIAFSGAPVLMVPLTIDHAAVHETISQLDTNVIPSGGSNLASAVELALKTFEKTGQKANALILISDGENHSQETEGTASDIRESDTTVCSISVGSEAGGIIPDRQQPDGKFRDSRNQTVLSRMIPDALDTLARAGHGTYIQASAGASTTVRSTLQSIKTSQQAGRKHSIPNEKYQWFLLPAILLLTLSALVRSQLFSKKLKDPTSVKVTKSPKTTAAIALCLLLNQSNPLHAAALDHAESAYERKDYSAALELFRKALSDTSGEDRYAVQFAMGTSAYRLKQWEKSTTYFSAALLTNNQTLQENIHYNLGKSLFRTGLHTLHPEQENESIFRNIIQKLFSLDDPEQTTSIPPEALQKVITLWQDSISHYQAAIDINPENQRAASNQKNVKLLLDLLQQSQQKKQEQEQNKDPDDQGHHPETDPNNDPDQQEGENPKEKGEGDEPDKDSKNKGEGDQQDPNKDESNNKKNDDSDNNDKQGDQQKNNPKDKPDMKRQTGETEEAYAARILKENSDSETRPIQHRIRQLRRPAKDW